MEALSKDVQDAIQKNLPSAVAGTLADFIKEAEEAKRRLPVVQSNYDDAVKRERVKDESISNLTAKVKAFKSREAEIADAETKLLIAGKDVEKAQAVSAAIRDVVGLVFANSVVKRTVFENNQVPVGMPTGGYVITHQGSSSRTETTEG